MGNVDFNKRFEDNSLKLAIWIVIVVVLGVVITFTVITATKIRSGEHVRLFGLEYNIPKDHPDTIVKTITVEVPTAKTGIVPNFGKVNKATKRIIVKDSVKPLIKYNITAPITQSAVGDGASVTNNNYEPKPRILSKDEAQTIFNAVTELIAKNKGFNTSTKVRYGIAIQDTEAIRFADQIFKNLYSNGFTNYEVRYAIFTGLRSSNFEVVKGSENNSDFIEIHIFSQKSVN